MAGDNHSRRLWESRLVGKVDEASVGCAGFGRNYNRWLYRLRRRIFRRTINRLGLDLPRCRILDVGSGSGFYLDQLQKIGAVRLEGLEFTEAGVAHLRDRFPGLTIHHADIAKPPDALPPSSFDLITAFDVLFHIVDDESYQAALEAMVRLLKPRGVLLLSENFAHHSRPRVSRYHYSRSLQEIVERLAAAGLQLVERRPMFVLMNAPDDSTSPLLRGWWRLASSVARRGELAGWLAGASLYPLDLALTSFLKEGPTTEIAVCRPARQ